MLAYIFTLIPVLCALFVKADFSQVVYANDSSINSQDSGCQWKNGLNDFLYVYAILVNWGYAGTPGPCIPAIYNGVPWSGGAIPTLTFEAADNTAPLPIAFSFNFTGTEFNVVGNDWHDGIVTFTLDGVPSAPYDLGTAINSTAVRCRFSWYNRTGLAPTSHTFTFNLTAPSNQVLTDTGYVPGYSVYFGIQFFYFSYTPVNATSTSYAPSSTYSIIPSDSKAPRITTISGATSLRANLGGTVWTSSSGDSCTPVEWDGGSWAGGPIPTLGYQQAAGDAADGGALPITFSFTFTGTAFNVVGNDWRDGIVTFSLDGQAQSPYDLGKATNVTGARCRFPWYTQTGLAPIQHTFQFNLTAPSTSVANGDGSSSAGSSIFFGVQVYYYSPISTTTAITALASSTGTVANSAAHHSNAAAFGAGIGVGIIVLIAIFVVLYFLLRSRRKGDEATDRPASNWNPGSSTLPQPAHYNQPAPMVATLASQTSTTNSHHYIPHPSYSPQVSSGTRGERYYSTHILPYVVPEITRSETESKTAASSAQPLSSVRPQSENTLSDTDIQRVAEMVVGMLPQPHQAGENGPRPSSASPPGYHPN
ncbi:hypothetical protein FRB96_006835 [Tulasnella sp. 330]|nr:hypothetical protein FRB96_006835 [Tulasnella sp. 330]